MITKIFPHSVLETSNVSKIISLIAIVMNVVEMKV